MKVYIGADHRGFNFKKQITHILEELHYDVIDVGVHEKGKICDYPIIGYKVAKAVSQDKDSRGILICLSGIGQTIIANKVRGAYAALCYNARTAVLSRQHNDANILVLSGRFGKKDELRNIIKKWMTTPFEGGRHKRRMQQIKRFEQEECRENQ